jgi:hypothetical protein
MDVIFSRAAAAVEVVPLLKLAVWINPFSEAQLA